MPLYMDLHIVPGITARGVAEAHVLDVNIQEEFQCSCLTYWVDEDNNSAFCLIEAPHEKAVRALHERSHGLLPHRIIEVNKNTVSTFLGRLYDPVFPQNQTGELKVFNDPAYRNIIMVDIIDPILLRFDIDNENHKELMALYENTIRDIGRRMGGEIVEHDEGITSILCFTSSSNALECALEILDAFTDKEKELLQLRISLNSGMPVSSSDRLFGETIDYGERLLYSSGKNKLVISNNIKNLTRIHLGANGENIILLTPAEEKLLNRILILIEHYSSDENFGMEKLCLEAGLSKSSLNRHIRALTSKSPNALLKDFRMNKSLKLLKSGDSISNVAYSAGFRSPSYFSKCFKEHYSISPSQYIEGLEAISSS